MKNLVIVALALLFIGLVVLTAFSSNILTAVSKEPTPTPDLALGTPEVGELPSPVPTAPPPTDLAPDVPFEEKAWVVFYEPEGHGFVTFLIPYEQIQEQVDAIGVEYLAGVYPSSDLLPGPDGEIPALLTAVPPATSAPTEP